MMRKGLLNVLLVIGLLANSAFGQTSSERMIQSMIGIWQAESQVVQPEMKISSTGTKRFVSRTVVEDQITTAITLSRLVTAPLILGVHLTSDWSLEGKNVELCERLTLFDVTVVSKPPAEVMPPLLVAEVVEQTQRELQQRLESKRASCNAIQFISPDIFVTKDVRSGQVIRFSRKR